MTSEELLFFNEMPDALPIYEAFRNRVTEEIPDVRIDVKRRRSHFQTSGCSPVSPLSRREGPRTAPVPTWS